MCIKPNSTPPAQMDVSQFTGTTRVLCQNSMKFDSKMHTGLLPSILEKFGDEDTFDATWYLYLVRSVCCLIVSPICYSCAGCCCLCGTWCMCMLNENDDNNNICCGISKHLYSRTTYWGKHTCLYETICGKQKEKEKQLNPT